MSELQRKNYTRVRADSEYLDFIRSLMAESDKVFKDLDVGAFIYQAVREYAREVAATGATPQGVDDWTQTAVAIDMILNADIENMRQEIEVA
jgi:hypothetical protein